MKEIKLYMPITESMGNNGISDGNIETYKNKPMLSLTKEELQNSTDNAVVIDGNIQKVIVEFSCFDIDKNCIPDVDRIAEILREEIKYWDDYLENDKKPVEFCNEALKVLDSNKVRCLRISDFNTTGLCGINSKKSSSWQNLVMNRGVSDKTGNKGGSFGIGKDAAFACSKLRTVLYNTINVDPVDNKGFQGVIKLPSYHNDCKNYDGTGFFGTVDKNKYGPIYESVSLEPGYTRTTPGMDKYIVGFGDKLTIDEIKDQIIVSSINNFLYAFKTDRLEVRFGDIIVNNSTLPDIMALYDSQMDTLTKEYYQTLLKPDAEFYESLIEENDLHIFIRLEEGYSRRAAMVRQSGMKVFDKDRFDSRIEFSAIAILEGDNLNKFFKKMENAEHTGWSIERASDRSLAEKYQKNIFHSINAKLRELRKELFKDTVDADGLSEYLPASYTGAEVDKKIESLSNKVKDRNKKKKAKKKSTKPVEKTTEDEAIIYQVDSDGQIIEDTVSVREKDAHEPTPVPPNPHPTPVREGEEVIVSPDGTEQHISEKDKMFISSRIIPSDRISYSLSRTGSTYKLKFRTTEKIDHGFFEIKISTEENAYDVNVFQATLNGNVTAENKHRIYFKDISPTVVNYVTFSLASDGDFALEVIANESKG